MADYRRSRQRQAIRARCVISARHPTHAAGLRFLERLRLAAEVRDEQRIVIEEIIEQPPTALLHEQGLLQSQVRSENRRQHITVLTTQRRAPD